MLVKILKVTSILQKQSSSDLLNPSGVPDRQTYTVHRQPIALDRLGIHDVPQQEATGNIIYVFFVKSSRTTHKQNLLKQVSIK